MTPDQFRAALQRIGWTGRELGRRLGHKSSAYVSQLACGTRPVPDGLGAWLDGLAGFMDGNPLQKPTPQATEYARVFLCFRTVVRF